MDQCFCHQMGYERVTVFASRENIGIDGFDTKLVVCTQLPVVRHFVGRVGNSSDCQMFVVVLVPVLGFGWFG